MVKIIKTFKPLGGRHCITTSLMQIFKHNGIDITESMLFGLGAGLSWFYMENKAMPFPIISGRIKPLLFEENISKALNIEMKINQPDTSKKAYDDVKACIENDMPVLIYADMAYLKYLGLPANAHFGGHSIVLFGIDEDKNTAYISDRDSNALPLIIKGKKVGSDYHLVPLNELSDARASKSFPFPAKNKWVSIKFEGIRNIDIDVVNECLKKTLNEMLNPPINNIGIKGIEKFAERIILWNNFDDKKLFSAAFNCFFMINESGGTGGGAFRNLFGEFLQESGKLTGNDQLYDFGADYIAISKIWDSVGYGMKNIAYTKNKSSIKLVSKMLYEIASREKIVMESIEKFIDEKFAIKQ